MKTASFGLKRSMTHSLTPAWRAEFGTPHIYEDGFVPIPPVQALQPPSSVDGRFSMCASAVGFQIVVNFCTTATLTSPSIKLLWITYPQESCPIKGVWVVLPGRQHGLPESR